MQSTSARDININRFDFEWVKETCRLVENELRRRESRYRARVLNSLRSEGREEGIVTDTPDPTFDADSAILHYAADRYSRSSSQRARSPPRFGSSTRDLRSRSPSAGRSTTRRPGDPITPLRPRLRSPSPRTPSARVHAIVPYDPIKNLEACLNCGNPGHRVVDCKHPKDETRIRTNMDLFQKHRKQSAIVQAKFKLVTPPQMVATFNSMRAE